MKMKLALLAASLLLLTAQANAATVDSSFNVSSSVQGTCVITSAEAINFGSYDPTSTHATNHLDASGSMSVRCTAGSTNVRLGLSPGTNPDPGASAGNPARRLASGTSRIYYMLYKEPSRTVSSWWEGTNMFGWPNTSPRDPILNSFTSSLTPVVVPIYARIFAGQNARIGNYTDTIAITVTF